MNYNQFRTIVINAVGRGTEASPSTTKSAWSLSHARVMDSAASIGFMQHDFGKRGGSAAVFLEEYNQWAQTENTNIADPLRRLPVLSSDQLKAGTKALSTAGDHGGEYDTFFTSKFGKQFRAAVDTFTSSAAGRATISFFDGAQADYLWEGTSLWSATSTFKGAQEFVGTPWFNSLNEEDQTRALVIYAKVTNQKGNANTLFTWAQAQPQVTADSADLLAQFQQKATTTYSTIHIDEAVNAADIHIRFINHPAFADAKAYWEAGGEIMGPGDGGVLQAQINLYHNLTLANKGGSAFTRETGNPGYRAAMRQTADGGRSICSWGSTNSPDDDYCISGVSKDGQPGWIYRNGEWIKFESGFEIQRTSAGALRFSFNGLPDTDLILSPTGVADLNINGTDVTLNASTGSTYAFDANGDLGSMTQDGNRWVGTVLTGENQGKSYAYTDFNLDEDGAGIRNATFSGVSPIGQSNNYEMEINDGQGRVTTTNIKPIWQNDDGRQVIVGSESSVKVASGGVTQSETVTRDSTNISTHDRSVTTDTTVFDDAGVFSNRNFTNSVITNAGLQLSQLDVIYDAQGSITQTSLTELQPNGSQTKVTRDGQGNTLSTVNTQSDAYDNFLVSTTNADGTGTVEAFNAQGEQTDSATFIKTGGMSATTGTLTKQIDGKSVVFGFSVAGVADLNVNLSNSFHLTGINSIAGQLVSDSSFTRSAFSAGNYDLGSLLGQSSGGMGYAIPSGLTSLIAHLDPQNPTGLPPVPTTDNKPWYESDGAQKLGGVLTSMQSLIASLKSGKPLAIANDAFSVLASASQNPGLKDITEPLGYANSLSNLAGALERGDDLAAFMSGASVVKQYAQSQASLALEALRGQISKTASASTQATLTESVFKDPAKLQAELAQDSAFSSSATGQTQLSDYVEKQNLFNQLNVGLSVLNVHTAFSTGGNDLGKAQAVCALVAAMNLGAISAWAGPVGWALAGISIIGSLFGSEPDIWGTAYAVNNADGTARAQVQENHDDGGLHAVDALDNLIDQLQGKLVGTGMGLIAQRLSGIQVWYDERPNTFILWFQDAQTGQSYGRGYDKEGKFLGELDAQARLMPADPTKDSFFGDMVQHFKDAAAKAGALAPLWMVQTAAQQTALGLPYAGLSTELRARNQGQWLASNPGNALPGNAGNLDDNSSQTARLITLDWDGNGSIAVATRAQGHGVLVDIDNDGSAEDTDWIGTHDAILVLDRDGDGQIDRGHDMFNDAQVDTAARGLHALDEVDANGDGKINASDPVYNQLKVWLDIQHDGQVQGFEAQTLAQAGISELDINAGQFVRSGHAGLLTTTALTADSAGAVVKAAGNNLLVINETGEATLMASALADFGKSTDDQVRESHTRLSASGSLKVVNELMDGLEDTAIVVSVEQLLKNDASLTAGTRSISMVGSAYGGTVSLDTANNTIRFTPSAEFSGEGSFRYVVTDAQGQKTTGKALVNVAGVNDTPVLINLGATRAAGSADFKTTGSTITMPTGNVPKLESPARLELGVAQANLAGVTILGATDSQHLVGQKDGQMYVGTLQGNLQPAWQTARVRVGIFGAVAGTDVDSSNALNYQKLLDGRYGTVEINANTGLWSYTQNSWPQYVTQDAFVVNAIDEHGGKAELKVVVQLDPLFDPLAPPVVYSDVRYDAAPPPTPVPAVVGAGDQVLHGDGGNNWIYGAAGDDKVYGGDGNDELGGDKGNDELFGEGGDDTLFGEEGADQMTGGDPIYGHYQNSSCLRRIDGRQSTFLYLKTWGHAANQSQWRSVA